MTALGIEQGAIYEFVGPLGDRAVIGPAPADPDFVGYLTEPPTGLERANVREAADDVAEADGGLHDDFLYGRLAFTMKGLLFPDAGAASSRQDKLMRATDAMTGDSSLLWTSELGLAVQVDFRQQQPTRITERRPKVFTLAGVSEDPVVWSQIEHRTLIVPSPATAGGRAYPKGYPKLYTPGVGDAAIVNNAGRSPSYPKIVVTGPGAAPLATNARVGRTLYFNYVLGVGENLVIDTDPRRRSILLNGATPRYSALDSARSKWWPLLPGDNDIRIGFANYSFGAQVEILHKDAWG